MNLRTFTLASIFTSCTVAWTVVFADTGTWRFDFSRRKLPSRGPAAVTEPGDGAATAGYLSRFLPANTQVHEVVILLTERGFVPQNVHVRSGDVYRLHVVNVNEMEKNVSFVLDAFSEHHATFFGKIRTFEIRPQKDGVYRFLSPETGAQGRLVVVPQRTLRLDQMEAEPPLPATGADLRQPAGE